MITVPLVDLARQYAPIAPAARSVFDRLAAAGAFTLGLELEAFELEFAAYCGTAHCVGTASGTDAIKLALQAVGAGPGTEVITAAMTFIATIEAIAATGARPVLADIDPYTRCLDPRVLEAAITPSTRAVVPVHLYGHPADMAGIAAACSGADVAIVEDAAQAHGARLAGRRAGALGAAAAFSFYPTKNLGAMGDGGAVTTDDAELAAVVRSLRHHGAAADNANHHERAGSTARLDNLQAAMLRLKLPRLEEGNAQRRAAAERYREALRDAPVALPPEDPSEGMQVHHLFVVEVADRDRILARLHEEGVSAGVHYPTPPHLQPAWQGLGYRRGDFPAAERLAQRALSLPLFPEVTDEEVDRAASALRRALT